MKTKQGDKREFPYQFKYLVAQNWIVATKPIVALLLRLNSSCEIVDISQAVMHFWKMLRSVFLFFCCQPLFSIKFVSGHHGWAIRHSENPMKEFSAKYGVMVSFEKPVYLNGYFLGFEGWDSINQQVSILSTFYSQLFSIKVFCAAFL